MIALDIRGINEAQRILNGVRADQLAYATARTINNTLFKLRPLSQQRLIAAFDRPTPLIQKATRVSKATKQTQEGKLFIDPRRASVLQVHEQGMARREQALERFLISNGWLPSGWRAVPCRAFPLDQYGNPKRSDIKRLMTVLVSGSRGTRNAKRYFVIRPERSARLKPGIYQTLNREISPLFLFVSRAQYRAILNWQGEMEQHAIRILPDEAKSAVQHTMKTAR